MREFKVGDKVESSQFGIGKIIGRGKGYDPYPLKVRFERGLLTFTFDGKWEESDAESSIFLLSPEEELKHKTTTYYAINVLASSALTTILQVAANLVKNDISPFIEDWQLPKTTPLKAKMKIVEEAEKRNEMSRDRALKLKESYDVLKNCF